MKRKCLITIFILFTSLTFCNAAGATDYFSIGKKAYYSGQYAHAGSFFRKELARHPENINCRYFYAQSLVKVSELKEAEKQYQKIIQISPLSDAARLSYRGIVLIQEYYKGENGYSGLTALDKRNKIRADLLEGLGPTYIDNAIDNGRIRRWNLHNMPIKLYIADGTAIAGYKPYYKQACIDALKAWATASGKGVSYKIIENPQKANIQVVFTPTIFAQSGSIEGKGFVSGLTIPFSSGRNLKYMQIKMSTGRPNGDAYTHDEFYATMLHEMGHAMGIMGHSNTSTDVMYPVSDSAHLKTTLNKRDVDTLKLLYRLDADITNLTEEQEEALTNKTKPSEANELVLGKNDERLDKKLKEAQIYVKTAPYHPISWTTLGNTYFVKKNYYDAVTNYKKALSIDPSYTDAKEGLAKSYTVLGDYPNAILLYRDLVSSDPKKIQFASNLASVYYSTKQYSEGQSVINNLIKQNPIALDDDNVKKLIIKFQGLSKSN